MNSTETVTIKKAQKRGKYHCLSCSDGKEYKVEQEIYYRYGLTEGRIIETDEFAAIIDENSYKLCLDAALRLLSQRMHSVYEVKTKLKKKTFLYKTIQGVIVELERTNLLNDEQFAKNYIEELILQGKGRYKIISSLQRRGIHRELIEDNLQELDDPDAEEKRAEEAFNKKLKSLTNAKLEPRKQKEKLIRHLMGKGFSPDVVFKTIEKL